MPNLWHLILAPLPNPKAAKTGSSRTFSSTATADCEANRCRCSVCRTLCSTLYPVLKVMPATPKKTNSKVPSFAIWLPILWIPACMNRPLNPWLAVLVATNYRWIGIHHQPKPSQLGNPRGIFLPKVSSSKPSSEPNKPPKHLGLSSVSGFVMESTAEDFGAKISEPWGKDGKGLSKTGCNWQTPRMFGLLPNNIGYTSGILTKHR